MKKLSLISAVSLIALAVAFSASAATVKTGEKYDLGEGESIEENLYVGSANVNVSGDVLGDFLAGGGNMMLTGKFSRDVMLAGGSINVLGPVSDDLRVFGGNINIGKDVGGDLVAVGGNIQLISDATVRGEMMVAGGAITIDGTVMKDLTAAGGELTINGKVNGNVNIKGVEKLTLGKNAVIKGNLNYVSPDEAVFMEGATVLGKTTYSPPTDLNGAAYGGWMGYADGSAYDGSKGALKALSALFHLMKFAAFLTAVLLLVHFFKDMFDRASGELMNNFWPEALRGFLVAAVVPLLGLFLTMTIIGIVPAFFLALVYVGVWGVSKLFAAIFIGGWLMKKLSKEKMFLINWKSAVLGTLSFFLLKEIPILGWLAIAVILCAAFGQLSKMLYSKTRELLAK